MGRKGSRIQVVGEGGCDGRCWEGFTRGVKGMGGNTDMEKWESEEGKRDERSYGGRGNGALKGSSEIRGM